MIDTPESGNTEPHQNDTNAAKGHRYTQYLMWPLKTVWRAFIAVISWLDKYDGAVTAIATIVIAVLTGYYVHYAKQQWAVMKGQLGEMVRQYPELQKSANAANSAADTARDTLVISNRPWLKIRHRIIKPLTFNLPGNPSGTTIYSMTIEDTIENVGSSVALNVFSWEDVLPMDADNSLRTARNRQNQWCDANRHRSAQGLSGYMLFPKDPFIANMGVGEYMKDILPLAKANKVLPGKVGFVLVVVFVMVLLSSPSPTQLTKLGSFTISEKFKLAADSSLT